MESLIKDNNIYSLYSPTPDLGTFIQRGFTALSQQEKYSLIQILSLKQAIPVLLIVVKMLNFLIITNQFDYDNVKKCVNIFTPYLISSTSENHNSTAQLFIMELTNAILGFVKETVNNRNSLNEIK
jgi:hypothetical protein